MTRRTRLTSSHSDVKDGVLSEFPFEGCSAVEDSLQLILDAFSFEGQAMRSESDLETFLDKCMSIRALGNDLILPRVHALSTNPPVLTTHWSPLRDPLLVTFVPTMV